MSENYTKVLNKKYLCHIAQAILAFLAQQSTKAEVQTDKNSGGGVGLE